MNKFILVFGVGILLLGASCGHSSKKTETGQATGQAAGYSAFPIAVLAGQYLDSSNELIKSARSSVDIYQADLTDRSLALQLINLKKERENDSTFRIRVLYTNATPWVLAKFKKAGFKFSPKSVEAYSYTQISNQTDYLMVDGHKILTGSISAAARGGNKNGLPSVIFDSTDLANGLLKYQEFVSSAPQNFQMQIINDGEVFLYLDRAYEKSIKRFLSIASAGDHITCFVKAFDVKGAISGELAELLAKAKTSREVVKLYLDSSQPGALSMNKKAAAVLAKDHMTEVVWVSKPATSLNFCVHGYSRGGFSVILGSSNWTDQDLTSSRQINWQIEDNDGVIAKPLLDSFKKL